MSKDKTYFNGPGGLVIPRLASDPSTADNGEIYYNITDSVFRKYEDGVWSDMTGSGGASFPLLAPDGTAAAPSYSFTDNSNMGLYRVGTNQIGFATNGANRLILGTSDLTPNTAGGLALGTASLPWSSVRSRTFAAYDNGGQIQGFVGAEITSPSGNTVSMSLHNTLSGANNHAALGVFTYSNGSSGTTGPVYLESGNSTWDNNSAASTGLIQVKTGDIVGTASINQSTGGLLIRTGDNASSHASGNSGDLLLQTGTVNAGVRGSVNIDSKFVYFPQHASAPSSPSAGATYYDTTDNKLYTYDGTIWQGHW